MLTGSGHKIGPCGIPKTFSIWKVDFCFLFD